MSKLLNYLNVLDKDAVAREAHATSPKTAMKKFDLDDDEQSAVMSGNKKQVASLIGISIEDLPSIIATPHSDKSNSNEIEFCAQVGAFIMYPNYFEYSSAHYQNSNVQSVRV